MNPAQQLSLLSLRVYRALISPLLQAVCGPGCGCRFEPTCSHYASEAIRHHGAVKGLRLAGRRLLRCHPWGGAGFDPVPVPSSVRKPAGGI